MQRIRFVYESSEQHQPVTRGEWCGIIVLTLVAGLLRLLALQEAGLSHFDEGVYALWGLGVGSPGQEFYAPPLFPLMLRGGFWLLGPSDVVARAASGIMGTATVPLVWWVARRWYGRSAALASAVMAAVSRFHIEFSRMALTDTAFSFWLVLAVWLASELYGRCRKHEAASGGAVRARGRAPGVWWVATCLGLAGAAAMNTKYNGFLSLALPAAALVVMAVSSRLRRQLHWGHAAGLWAVAALIALIGYAPWFGHVQSQFGYTRLLAHHRGYAMGVAAWPDNFLTLLASQWCISGWLGCVGPVVSVAAVLGLQRRLWFQPRVLAIVVGVLASSLVLGDSAGWLFGGVAILLRLRTHGPAAMLHLVWLIGLIVLTPLYRPYARLLLPLLACGWIAGGYLIAVLVQEAPAGRQSRGAILFSVGAIVVAIAVYWKFARPVAARAGDSSPVLKSACNEVVEQMAPDAAAASFVRPPVLFYVAGRRSVRPVEKLDWLQTPSSQISPRYLLVDRALLRDNPDGRQQLERAADRLREQARIAYRPSVAVLLDDFGRQCLSPEITGLAAETYQLVLYRIEPTAVGHN